MRAVKSSDKRELWLRLHNYHFDHLVPSHLIDHVAAAFGGPDASSKAFASKLGRKLKWRTPFALRAIAEYKKFLYLGVVSDFFVTPPKAIDMVWHEHLLFTRGYRDFCRDVLRQDFDHSPELVPTSGQTDVFQAQYQATLDRYLREFGVTPPEAIWGTPKFDESAVKRGKKDLKKRDTSGGGDYSDNTPVCTMFGHDYGDTGSASTFSFGEGGGFSGGGSSGSFGDGHDAGHDGSSDGGADGGSSDGGGSGCSSGCGGGGCGGGD